MTVAAIDIGTNTARLLVAESTPDGLVDAVRIARVCGLGRGVDASGRLAPDAIARTLDVLADYARHLPEVDRVRVIATSASRDAANREEFFDAAESILGHRPELISGDEEAALSFAGATTGRSGAGPVLVVDIGGGSTEFVFGEGHPAYAVSIDMGSVRLTDRLLGDRPVPTETLEAARRQAGQALQTVRLPGRPAEALGVAGTFTSLVAIALELPAYDRQQVDQSVLTLQQVTALVEDLAVRSLTDTAAIPSLDPGRAPVILGGAIVAEQLMTGLHLPAVIISEHDLLDGVVLSLLPQ